MMKRMMVVLVSGLLLAFLAGCGGDPAQKMLEKPEMQSHLIDLMVADPAIADAFVGRLLGGTETRGALLDKALTDGTFSQELMLRMSKDPSFVSGVIGLSMQDSTMKDQLMAMFKGMQMMQ